MMYRKRKDYMKKIALVLCAVMTFSCMNSVFAATTSTDAADSRNDTTIFTENKNGDMPSFRAGDTLSFDVSNLATGTQLTVISYKVSGEIGNDTVQYIDQRTIDEAQDTVQYKIRDIEDGIYCVSVKDGNDDAAYTLYYKVGTPKYEVVKNTDEATNADTNYYVKVEKTTDTGTVYSVGYLGKAHFKTDELAFDDYGINGFGFRYSIEGYEDMDVAPTSAQAAELQKQISELMEKHEGTGEFDFYYINTISNVPGADLDSITAKATMYDSDNTTITVEQ